MFISADDNMVMDGNVNGTGGLYQCLGQLPVGPGWSGISAGMVVNKD
jgi:hypothetical protein